MIVKSIERDFVPLLIRNNQPGREAELLKTYRERSWNNPVVRIIDSDGKDLIPRKEGVYTTKEIQTRMANALAKVPTQRIALSQHCFWTGELEIGGIKGVTRTEAGWLDGREVTLVDFDASQISQKALVKQAQAASCADRVYSGKALKNYRTARDSDQKRQLQGTPFAKVSGLSDFQKTKLNAFARANPKKARSYLTPEQLKQL